MTRQLWDVPDDDAFFGRFLAESLPNVEILKLTAAIDLMHGVIQAYAVIGKNLKYLTLNTPVVYHREVSETRFHLCKQIGALSPQLVEFQVEYGSYVRCCQIMFDREWPKLERLSFLGCAGESGFFKDIYECEGINCVQLRSLFQRLMDSRPMADISVGYSGRELVLKKPGRPGSLAGAEGFSKFDFELQGV